MRIAILAPPLAGDVALDPGRAIAFGAGPGADVRIPGARLAAIHFTLERAGRAIRLRAAGDAGTFVDGRRVADATLAPGDRIEAGNASFTLSQDVDDAAARASVRVIRWSAPDPGAAPDAVLEALLPTLAVPGFALLDAARDERVLDLVRDAGPAAACLFPPEHEVRLGRAAPYLVRLPDGAPRSIPRLHEAFGASWGVYLASRASPDRLVASLRRLLFLEGEDGRPLYFRFYDPRVLRVFLPIATPYQADVFFAAVDAFLVEGDRDRTMLEITPTDRPGTID